MASTETPAAAAEAEKVAEAAPTSTEVEKEAEAPPPEVKASADAPPVDYFAVAEVVLRFLLFASAVVAVVVTVTSNQTKQVPLQFPPFQASLPAKFNHSPAFIYFVAALSVAGLYSIITTLLSFYALLKPGCCPQVLSHFVIFDVLLLGVVASATGAAGAVAYIGLRGNSHLGWKKACNVYDEFCKHVGSSIFVSLFASIVLTLLVLLSIYSLSKKITK
ncbi:CASP-like protein 1 [Sesamum indicum]|uniref:CASP-like protein n=1 Tax=Sesamum indicum TaxID=4182 RepID=A0A6I9SN66_SESIN|nr:CASP-like protein 1 [Sesamum indicum]